MSKAVSFALVTRISWSYIADTQETECTVKVSNPNIGEIAISGRYSINPGIMPTLECCAHGDVVKIGRDGKNKNDYTILKNFSEEKRMRNFVKTYREKQFSK